MTDDQLAEIEARLAAMQEARRKAGRWDYHSGGHAQARARFELLAPEDIRLLLREVRALQERLSYYHAKRGELVG